MEKPKQESLTIEGETVEDILKQVISFPLDKVPPVVNLLLNRGELIQFIDLWEAVTKKYYTRRKGETREEFILRGLNDCIERLRSRGEFD